MVPYKDGGANEGHSCVKGRFAFGYASAPRPGAEPDDAGEDHRRVARGRVGRGDRLRGAPLPRDPGRARRRARSAASPRRARPTKRSTSSSGWCVRRSATTTSTPAPGSATPRPATASSRPSAPRPARRTSRSVDKCRRDGRDRRQPDRRAPGVRVADEAAAARGREAHRHRPAPDRPGAHPARRGAVPPAARAGHQRRGRSTRWRTSS